METKKRIIYPDLLRIIATIGVITIHAPALTGNIQPYTFDNDVLMFFSSVSRWSVPLFFMLSGMLFLNPQINLTYKKIFTKSIPRILVALIFWGIIYLGFGVGWKSIFQDTASLITFCKTCVRYLFFGPPWYHLWFLYAIIGLYILTPLLRIFVKHARKKDFEYLLVIYAIWGMVIPLCNLVYKFPIAFTIPELAGYAGYFIAGYYFSHYQLTDKTRKLIYCLGVLSILFTVSIVIFLSRRDLHEIYEFRSYLLPTIMFPTYAIFIFFKQRKDAKWMATINRRLHLPLIAKCCFGVYLVHDLVLQQFSIIGFSGDFINPVFSMPIIIIATFFVSLAISLVIARIPILNKWIM